MLKKANLRKYSIPFFALNIIFVIIPLVIILVYAFTAVDPATQNITFSFANFVEFFSSRVYVISVLKSVLIAFISALICLIIAYPVALILTDRKLKIPSIMVLIFIIPMWINSLLRILALKNALLLLGISEGYFSIVAGLVYDFFPFMLLPIYTILSNIDKSYIEASGDLGASPLFTLLKVKLPLSVPGIISGMLMVFTPAISSFAVHDMMGGTKGFMLGSIINGKFNSDSSEWHLSSALALIMLAIVLITMVISSLLSKGKNKAGGRIL